MVVDCAMPSIISHQNIHFRFNQPEAHQNNLKHLMRIYANILAVRRSWVRKFRSKKDLFFQWSLKTKYSKTFCGPQMFYWFATNERTIVINEYIFWMFWVFFYFFACFAPKFIIRIYKRHWKTWKCFMSRDFAFRRPVDIRSTRILWFVPQKKLHASLEKHCFLHKK